MKKINKNKAVKELNRVTSSLDTIYIVITAAFLGTIYAFMAKPVRLADMSSKSITEIIAIATAFHVIFAFTIFPHIILKLQKTVSNLYWSAAAACFLANISAIITRYLIFPYNTENLHETAYMAASILITFLLLSMPGWLFFTFRNQDRLVAALRRSGIAVQDMQDTASFLDDLQKLLPVSKRGHLLSLKASGNYTEVVTTVGSHMLRIGIGEAERKTKASGLRVHKSYWVARDEILRLIYTSGNPQIVTQSGKTLPVSRSAVPAIRAILAEGVAS